VLVALYRQQLARLVVIWHGALTREGTTTKGELIDPAGWDSRPDPRFDQQRMNWGWISRTEMLTAQGKIGAYYKHSRRPPRAVDINLALDSFPVVHSDLKTGETL